MASSPARSGAPAAHVRRLERHARASVRQLERALEEQLPGIASAAWALLAPGRPAPAVVRTPFVGVDDTTRGLGLLGAYDHVRHEIGLNVTALATGIVLRGHPLDGDPCWTRLGDRLHPAAVLGPPAMTLVHELVHAATWREGVDATVINGSWPPPQQDGSAHRTVRRLGGVRWPLYEQALVEIDGRIVGSLVDPRRRALLEGITDARAAQLVALIAPEVPEWLGQPAPPEVWRAHPRAELASYGGRDVIELVCTPDEIAALLEGPADWDALCERALARMPPDEGLVARGWLSGDLERFVAASSLPDDHPFRRVGWRSIAAWIRLGDAAAAA